MQRAFHEVCHVVPGQGQSLFIFELPFGSRTTAIVAPIDGRIDQVDVGNVIVYSPKLADAFPGSDLGRLVPLHWPTAGRGERHRIHVTWLKGAVGPRKLTLVASY